MSRGLVSPALELLIPCFIRLVLPVFSEGRLSLDEYSQYHIESISQNEGNPAGTKIRKYKKTLAKIYTVSFVALWKEIALPSKKLLNTGTNYQND